MGNNTHTASLKSLPIVSEAIVVSVAEELNSLYQHVSLYPNPIKNTLNISSNKPIRGVIEILDMNGKIVYSNTVNESKNHKINLGLKHGIYIIHFLQEDAQPIVRKLMVSD